MSNCEEFVFTDPTRREQRSSLPGAGSWLHALTIRNDNNPRVSPARKLYRITPSHSRAFCTYSPISNIFPQCTVARMWLQFTWSSHTNPVLTDTIKGKTGPRAIRKRRQEESGQGRCHQGNRAESVVRETNLCPGALAKDFNSCAQFHEHFQHLPQTLDCVSACQVRFLVRASFGYDGLEMYNSEF